MAPHPVPSPVAGMASHPRAVAGGPIADMTPHPHALACGPVAGMARHPRALAGGSVAGLGPFMLWAETRARSPQEAVRIGQSALHRAERQLDGCLIGTGNDTVPSSVCTFELKATRSFDAEEVFLKSVALPRTG
ncbi:hypothetical protein NDU88_003998 [Pleurodeles waltl]|uniref:Uncharacterized protein n=1 Tax=Pleurodeles waltl TaxID=8319 RepID=A0AAV7W6V3_PLEWA|nr:hypothetical protein NDU88_003998 [Pleurodeles waltl]